LDERIKSAFSENDNESDDNNTLLTPTEVFRTIVVLHSIMLEQVETRLSDNDATTILTLFDRLIADLFNEYMLNMARLLAETHKFEALLLLTQEATEKSDLWEESWKKAAPVSNYSDHYTFSPMVGEMQRASLNAWCALAYYMCNYDSEQRKDHSTQVMAYVTAALKKVPTHPIALLVNAWVLRDHHEQERAIDIYNRLLDVSAPYLPQLSIDLIYDAPTERGSDKQREDFYYMERVAGRQQFQGFTTMWHIHAEMADTFFEMGEINESTFHWAEAIRWSPYLDVDLKLLIKLCEVFIDAERYEQGLATSRSANNLAHQLDNENFPNMLQYRPRILESIAQSRIEDHARAVDNALHIFEDLRKYSVRNSEQRISQSQSASKNRKTSLLTEFQFLMT
ncbi:MAG: hypothetical protein AAFR67_14995, partial [Chloroflexota bacterium]